MNFASFRAMSSAALLIFVVFSFACNSINQAVQQTQNGAAGKSNLFENQNDVQSMKTALTKAVGSENPSLLEMLIYSDYAMIQVQDPKKPENVDSYTFRDGALSPPQPVKLHGGGELKDNVFPLNDIDLSNIPALSKEINEKLKDVEGGKLVGYSISRNLPFSEDVKINILTSATRKSVSATADAKGKLLKFEAK